MIQRKETGRLMPLRKMLLFCGIVGCIMAALSTPTVGICQNASIETASDRYGDLIVCLPEDVTVEGESMPMEANYTNGSEVALSILVDGNRVGLHLIYPCQAPEEELAPAELKPYLEDYNPILAQATYNESVPGPALWGQIGNQMLIAYQPINQTIALLLIDMNMSEIMMTTFLDNLSIIIYRDVAPASNCADTTGTTGTTIEQAAPAQDTETAETITNETTTVQTPAEKIVTGKEKMISDMEAAQARMAELMKNR